MRKYHFINRKQRLWLLKHYPWLADNNNMTVLDGILYLLRSGCQWRLIPERFGNWKTIYHHFRSWSERGHFLNMLHRLVRDKRRKCKQRIRPTVVVIDSQTVKSGLPNSQKGIDGNKKIKGIKRHIVVDSNGFPLNVVATTANVHDSKGAWPVIGQTVASHPSVITVKADCGYAGTAKLAVKNINGLKISCVKSNFGTTDFVPLEGRWVVERTIAWLDNYRRLARNYERLLATARHMAILGCFAIMLKHAS